MDNFQDVKWVYGLLLSCLRFNTEHQKNNFGYTYSFQLIFNHLYPTATATRLSKQRRTDCIQNLPYFHRYAAYKKGRGVCINNLPYCSRYAVQKLHMEDIMVEKYHYQLPRSYQNRVAVKVWQIRQNWVDETVRAQMIRKVMLSFRTE